VLCRSERELWYSEVRPAVAAQNLFGNMVQGGAAAVARQQQLNESILDLVAKDLGALQKQVPGSQRPKLDAHLAAIQHLESQIAGLPSRTCTPPTLEPPLTMVPAGSKAGLRIDALEHNTFVVFFSEVALGAGHGWTKMPVTFFGGKSVGLQTGRNLMMNGRYLNDIWAAVLPAFGLTLPADNKFGGYNV